MSAAAADRDAKRSEGQVKAFPVAASTTIYKDTLVGLNSSGYLVPMSDTAGLSFAGVACEKKDNSSGSNGDLSCRVRQTGEFEFAYAGGDAAQALVGEVAYAQDDQTVDEDVTLKVQTFAVGRISEYVSTTKVRVKIDGFAHGNPQQDAQRYAKRRVTAKTADYTVLPSESGQVFTTVGAAGTVVFTLPDAVVGLEYFFRVGAAQELRIDPLATDTIALPSTGVQGAAGKYLTANADGETVHIVCDKADQWSVYGYTGTWTAEA